MTADIEVSIIIPSFNSLDKLPSALRAIENLNFPTNNFELIIVDDGSTDGTQDYIASYIENTRISVTYIYQENAGPAAARNTGIRRALGEFLLFLDSDSYVDSDILVHFLGHFPQPGLGGVGGDVIPDYLNIITEFLDAVGTWRPGEDSSGRVTYLVTANAFFLKQAVVEAGYFDEGFRIPGGEEPELCFRMRKIGYHFLFEKRSKVIHTHQNNLKALIGMSLNHGKGKAIMLTKWPNSGSILKFWRVALGNNSFKWIRAIGLRKRLITTTISFWVLDYIRQWAIYCGFRSEFQQK